MCKSMTVGSVLSMANRPIRMGEQVANRVSGRFRNTISDCMIPPEAKSIIPVNSLCL